MLHLNQANDSLGLIYDIYKDMAQAAIPDSNLNILINAIDNIIMGQDTTFTFDSTYLDLMDTIRSKLITYAHDYNSFINNFTNECNASINELNLVNVNGPVLKNMKHTLKNTLTNYTTNSIDSTLIMNIANECPIEGGDGVYLARGIIDIQDAPTDYDDAWNCTPISQRSKVHNNPPITTIYPNPSTGIVNIRSNKFIARIEVFDHLNNLVFSDEVGKKVHKLDFNFKSGLYILKLQNHTNHSEIKKFIIVNE